MTDHLPEEGIWGLVYNEPGMPDALLSQRFSRESVALRIAYHIGRQFIAQAPGSEQPYLNVHRSPQHVISVSSSHTGRVYFTIRPVIAASYLAGGRQAAPPEVDTRIQRLLDDDDWEKP